MKRIYRIMAAAVAMGLTLSAHAAQPILTNYTFAATNPLASGKWVKITTEGSGVYEITYERLREMGFDNPGRVAVYGMGGLKRNLNFMSSAGKRVLEDVIQPVPVVHNGGKLIFYGQGDRKLTFCMSGAGTQKHPQFVRESLNTYSEKTCYMLTDSREIMVPAQGPQASSEAVEIESAYAYLYHEKESVNGLSDSGEFWWGENIWNNPTLKFTVEAPYCSADTKMSFYSDVAVCHANIAGSLNVSINNNIVSMSLNKNKTQVYQLYSHSSQNKFVVDESTGRGHAEIEFKSVGNYGDWGLDLGLDYWLIAYNTSFNKIDGDADFSQFTAGFSNPGNTLWRHHAPEGTLVWDITNPMAPVALNTDGGYFYNDRQGSGSMVVFDPSKPQRQIDPEYVEVANQDLHKMQQTPYDMIIFTVDHMRPYADRIAKLHEQYDGMNVAVFTNEEIFNEFNAGTPEPVCYRMVSKMLYQHPERRLKNILFLGPLHGDFRNIKNVPDRIPGMIAYQDNLSDLSTCSNVAMDYYGIMTDNLGSVTRIQDAPISLGVAVLPIDNDHEGELAVAKIRAYLEKEDFSGMVNSTYSIGCDGDDHIHEKQAIAFGTTLNSLVSNNLKSKFAHETLWREALHPELAADRIQQAMRRGKSLMYYYGHSTSRGFTGLNTFQTLNAGNNELGVLFLGGCDLTALDKGIRGIGDAGVTRSKNGFIGILASTRTVMSNHNEALGNNFLNSMFFGRDDKWRRATPTIGEVLARAKENTANNSEVCYMYVGDPALRVPMALVPVKVNEISGSFRSGDVATVSGNIVDLAGNINLGYNGFVTVTVMEPPRMVTSPEPADPKEVKMPDFELNDLPLISVKGVVSNGAFSVKVPLTGDFSSFMSDENGIVNLPVLVGTWDNSARLGGSGAGSLTMAAFDAEPDPEAESDTSAPEISIAYDNVLGVVTVEAREDVAMLPGIGPGCGMTLSIDGNETLLSHGFSKGEALTRSEGYVAVAGLGAGSHTAVATAVDIAGNASTQTLDFTIEHPIPLTLSAGSSIATGELNLRLAGADPDLTYCLVVADNKGRVFAGKEISGTAATLDTTGLPAGMYRAYVRHDSPMGEKANSNEIEFTVID